tara:strand:+ start:585 stop:2729 length:2145 start_codon:yes stop_codon:yes gene_type:complete
MELYERLNLAKINYLYKMNFDEFKRHCSSSCKNEAERKIKFEMMRKFCQANIKAKGEVRRIYAYTLKTPVEVGGRLYCGNSVQGLSRPIRGFLCGDIMTDVDMKNAHPVIARYLCQKNNIECPNLSYYIEHRDTICQRFTDGKTAFLKALNDDKPNKKLKDEFFQAFDKECKFIQKAITDLPVYKHIVDTTPLDKSYNWNGSAFNRIMCVYENKIIQEAITVLNSKHIDIAVLMFDGIMIYGNHYADEGLLRAIEERVNSQYEGLNMLFAYKEHADDIKIPEDYEENTEEGNEDDCYEKIKAEFEKTHAKIISKAVYIEERLDDDLVIMSRTKMKDAYEHLKYIDYSGEIRKTKSFILAWFNDEDIRQYKDMGVYPPPITIPKATYNLWKPFEASKYTGHYEKDEIGLQKFLNHIKILCGNEEKVAEYCTQWLAQMFQYPAVKTVALTFISEEGAGKGTLLDLIGRLMGMRKTMESTQPSRDCWGQFNSIMSSSFLVNLNEMCKKEAQDAEGKIKGLITDARLIINKKNQDPYEVSSYHRFLITSNNEDPINTKKGDRRNVIIRSSDEKIDDIAYFTDLRETFAQVRTQRTIYDYLMGIEGMDKFHSIPRPESEHQEDMKIVKRSYYDRWIEDMVRDCDESEIEFYGEEQCTQFVQWLTKNRITFETNTIKMPLAIKRLKIPGVKTGVRSISGRNKTTYDIPVLKKHYKIGLQL